MRSNDYDAPGAGARAAIWPSKMYRGNEAVGTRLKPMDYGIRFKPMDYGIRFKPSAGILGLGRVHACIILGTDWTERHAARVTAALRPLIIEHAVASLREDSKRHTERPQHLRDDGVEIARRNSRHGIVRRSRCPPGLGVGARNA